MKRILQLSCSLAALAAITVSAQQIEFPVEPELIVDEPFGGCEGIAFNGEGRLFVSCNRAFWEISIGGEPRKIADLDSNLGVAAIGERDLLVADFGPTNAFRQDRNSDGVVWRISPDGDKQPDATGMGDPNFVLVMPDLSYLVSDDATADIYHVDLDRNVTLFTTAVNHPNGLALSPDRSTLYVAQIFTSIRPVVADNTVWAIELADGKPVRDATLMVRAGPDAAVDGLTVDSEGRVYIAANMEGKIWRYDPRTREMTLIAEGMFGIASLAFGEGEFDHESLYGTATFSQGRGGKVWRIPVGATSGPIYR